MTCTIHLHPTAPLAERVLLPGDPGRALRLAEALLAEARMFNHNRGLWGYTGTTPGGERLTVQSTGMGGPSAAIVISELAQLGARTMVRLGTCGALDPGLRLGELVLVGEALASDGASRALGADERVKPDSRLLAALSRAGAPPPVVVASTDLFYEADPGRTKRSDSAHGNDPGREQSWREAGAVAVEMESATLFSLASNLGLSAASLLTVSDLIAEPPRARIDADCLHAAELRMGELALRALFAG